MAVKIFVWLSGYAGSGKDATASILCEKYGFTRYAFADSLKDYVAKLHNFDRKLCDSQEGKKTVLSNGKTVRQLLISESAAKKRDDKNYFAREVAERIKEDKSCKIVISDWRFLEEINFLSDAFLGWKHLTIRVVRPNIECIEDESEHQLDNYDFDNFIINDKSFNYLDNDLKKIFFHK
jgi:dephospho-CoA kinase